MHLDARWYNPQTTRFIQPDLWNFASTGLPKDVQHEVMQFAGLNVEQLLRDPGQQMRFGYVSNSPLSWVDPFGLAETDLEVANRILQSNPIQFPANIPSKNAPTADGRYSPEGEYRTGTDGNPKPHNGTDYAAPVGTSVHSPADGVVVYSDRNRSGDEVVIVDHGEGIRTRYRHLDTRTAVEGQVVKQDQKLGTVGTTGNVPAGGTPHLHYEVVAGNGTRYVNPENVNYTPVPGYERAKGC